MLAMTEPGVRKITVKACTQLMKTELINNIVGYFIHQDPSPMIVMQPTGKMAEAWSKDRLDKMIRDTPTLRGLVKDKKSRDSDNTILHKAFPGGHITIVGSNSPSDLAMRPVRIVLCDEVDKYPQSAGKEGDPIKLIEERSATFWNALAINVCSPTVDGSSRIDQEYEQSDKRIFCVPCPHCGEADEMKWESVRWEKNAPDTAHYVCPFCSSVWTEQERINSIGKGFYKATAPFTGHAGFKVNKLASPWEPLATLARKWLEAQKNPETLKTFVNTQLAETWVEKGEAPEYKRLYERRETYDINQLQPGILLITAGADVQKDRIEVEIVGWGKDKQSWSIDYRVIVGETSTEAPWKELDKLLNETWQLPDNRPISISVLAIDSGYNTQHVYNWARKHSVDRIRVIKGQESLGTAFGMPRAVDYTKNGVTVKRSIKMWPVGVSVLKTELYSWLKLDGPSENEPFPAGFCHFPQYNEEYFKGLTAEQLMKKTVNGNVHYRWVKVYERNEPLDCRVYARAAAAMFGIDRLSDLDWQVLNGDFEPPRPRNIQKTLPATPVSNAPSPPTTSPFWGNKRKTIW